MVLHLIMTLFSEIVGEMLHKVPTIRMPVWLNKCSDQMVLRCMGLPEYPLPQKQSLYKMDKSTGSI